MKCYGFRLFFAVCCLKMTDILLFKKTQIFQICKSDSPSRFSRYIFPRLFLIIFETNRRFFVLTLRWLLSFVINQLSQKANVSFDVPNVVLSFPNHFSWCYFPWICHWIFLYRLVPKEAVWGTLPAWPFSPSLVSRPPVPTNSVIRDICSHIIQKASQIHFFVCQSNFLSCSLFFENKSRPPESIIVVSIFPSLIQSVFFSIPQNKNWMLVIELIGDGPTAPTAKPLLQMKEI